jgi:hypothetical protein
MRTEMSPLPTGEAVAGEHILDDLRERPDTRQLKLSSLPRKQTRKPEQARKQANWKIKIYERMVAEYNGQLKLPVE